MRQRSPPRLSLAALNNWHCFDLPRIHHFHAILHSAIRPSEEPPSASLLHKQLQPSRRPTQLMEDYTKGIVLGTGTFGKVLKATHKEVIGALSHA